MLTCTVSAHPPVPARYTRYVSIFLRCFFLNRHITNTWTKIDSGTTLSSKRGRFPKRIGPNTHPNLGMANTDGFDPPMSCAWSNTGVDCGLTKHSTIKLRPRPSAVPFRAHCLSTFRQDVACTRKHLGPLAISSRPSRDFWEFT
jgi:hypothetical protein